MKFVNPFISTSFEGDVWKTPEFVEENCENYIEELIKLKESNK